MTDTAAQGAADEDAYSGVLGAFGYAFRATESRLLRSYVVVAAVTTALVTLFFGMSLVVWFTATLGQTVLTTSSNAFLVVIAFFIALPILTPILLVARRHRRGFANTDNYDAALALTGYAFIVSLYVGLVISVPPEFQTEGAGAIAGFLYGLPQLFGVLPPIMAAALIALVHWTAR